ncbi:hypothetical protein J7E70_16035 [Variovorax paradoxus]|nr:hypothetical protein [Variovorax paradoxus]MBT2301973.1 hypothetical protein [Variovorax paradoxus]
MNNSFARLIDGMNATLRAEVLTRLDDEFARGQVFGVINLLNTFKTRADWSGGFLLQQITAQQEALAGAAPLLQQAAPRAAQPLPALPPETTFDPTPVSSLLERRDANNRAFSELLSWIDANREQLDASATQQAEALLRRGMRAEVDLELKNSPRPLFAEMSSGREG